MNRTIKDATLKVFHYPDLDSLKAHVLAFVRTYRPCAGKRPSRSSAKPGQLILQSSESTRVTSSRDQTPLVLDQLFRDQLLPLPKVPVVWHVAR
jgi:hypothetical protein